MTMISLVIVKYPFSYTLEKNPECAKLSIDTLDMLFQKTKGNFFEYEEKLLTETVNQLKITYGEETSNETNAGPKLNNEKQSKEK